MKFLATLTAFEPNTRKPTPKWGSTCIVVSKKGKLEAPISVLSTAGMRKIENGGIVRFFPEDIGYRELRELFGEI